MPSAFLSPCPGVQSVASDIITGSHGVLVTNTSANTKGTEVQIITDAPESFGFWLYVTNIFGVQDQERFLVDVLITRSQSTTKELLVPDVPYYMGKGEMYQRAYFPMHVPKGSEIWIRHQSNHNSATPWEIYAQIQFNKSDMESPRGYARATALGEVTSGDTNGTQCLNTVADTPGPWVDFGEVTHPTKAIILSAFPPGGTLSDGYILFDVAAADATGDIRDFLLEKVPFRETGGEDLTPCNAGAFGVGHVQPNTNFWVREQANSTNSDLELYAVLTCMG